MTDKDKRVQTPRRTIDKGKQAIYVQTAKRRKQATAYLIECKQIGKIPTISRLAQSLGYPSIKAMLQAKDDETHVQYRLTNEVLLELQAEFESLLYNSNGNITNGVIFALRQLGWSDKPQIQVAIQANSIVLDTKITDTLKVISNKLLQDKE